MRMRVDARFVDMFVGVPAPDRRIVSVSVMQVVVQMHVVVRERIVALTSGAQ